MPKGIGYKGGKEHDALVRLVVEQAEFFREQLQDRWQRMVKHKRLYLTDRVDRRSAQEKTWRAAMATNRPYANVETKVAVMADIILSVDPMVQVEGVGDEDTDFAIRTETLLDYSLRQEKFRKKLPPGLRDTSIYGTTYWKTTWLNKSHSVEMPFSRKDVIAYSQILLDAVNAGAPPPPDPENSPTEFELWRKVVNDGLGSKGIRVPEPPSPGAKMVVTHEGPQLTQISPFDIWLDPLIDDIDEQDLVVHRVYKSREWLERRVKDGTYSAEAVEKCLHNAEGMRFSEQDEEINQVLEIPPFEGGDPTMKNPVELWECFRPQSEMKHLVILNRTGVINKHPKKMPYNHGRVPIHPVRNVVLAGQMLGISDLQPNEWLYYELTTLRNLRLDAVTLSVLPIFTRMRAGGGLPDLKKYLTPGKLLDVDRADAIQQLTKMQIPGEAFQEVGELKEESDEGFGIGGNVRGQTATVGRVSATESTSRLNQAMARLKLHALTFENDWEPHLEQSIALWQQFGTTEVREKIAQIDPLLNFSAGDLERALTCDLRFRGATRAIAKDLVAQQLMMFGEKNAANMIPKEARALMELVYQTLSLRNMDKVISVEGTRDLDQAYTIKKELAMAQAQAQKMATMAQSMGPPQQPGGPEAAKASGEAKAAQDAMAAAQASAGGGGAPGGAPGGVGEDPETGEGPGG